MNKSMLKIAILEEIERMIGEDALVDPTKNDFHIRGQSGFDTFDMFNEKSACSECGGSMYEGECADCGYVNEMLNEGGCGCGTCPGCSSPGTDYSIVTMRNTDNHLEKLDSHKYQNNNYMAKPSLYKVAKYSKKLLQMIPDGYELDDWQRTKIAQIADDISEVYHSLDYDFHDDEY